MSSFTFADNKLGGRYLAAADAIAAGHLRKAAGILAEISSELNVEAESSDGLLSEEAAQEEASPEADALPSDHNLSVELPEPPAPTLAVKGQPADLQMCGRGVHNYAAPDFRGWRTCLICGNVNVAPPDNNGPIDLGARNAALGDL